MEEDISREIEEILLNNVPQITVDECICVSSAGNELLEIIYSTIDKDKDNLISEEEIDMIFASTSKENLFESFHSNFWQICETVEQNNTKYMTLKGWKSLWNLIGYLNPFTFLKFCFLSGCQEESLSNLLSIHKKRKARAEEGKAPSLINCFIFGAPRAGKTSIMSKFVNQLPTNFETQPYKRTEQQNVVVNSITYEDAEYYLAITEFEYGEVNAVLKDDSIMSKCDVACLVFDGNDPYSFANIAFVQRSIFDKTIPVVYVLTKRDLEIVEQEFDVSPKEFCEELSLSWPCQTISLLPDSDTKINDLFTELVASAMYPSIALPLIKQESESEEEEEEKSVNKKSTKSSASSGNGTKWIGISLLSAAVLVSGYFVYKKLKSNK